MLLQSEFTKKDVQGRVCCIYNVLFYKMYLTLVLLNPDCPAFANSVDPDQLASEEAN